MFVKSWHGCQDSFYVHMLTDLILYVNSIILTIIPQYQYHSKTFITTPNTKIL